MSDIKLSKSRKVKLPSRGTPKSAGLDFYIPEDITIDELTTVYSKIGADIPEVETEDKDNINVIIKFIIKPGKCLFIPSGIRCIIPPNMMLKFDNKSGIATKKGLTVVANIVDEDYRGICHLHLMNISDHDVTVEAGTKICQGILIPVEYASVKEVSESEILSNSTERGQGGFGSTGIK